jgi:hypothetical protein
VICPAEITNVPPTVTGVAGVMSSDPRNVPDVDASQNETCEYVSAFGTELNVMSADVVIDPPDAALNVAACLNVFAAAFAVPALPGSPMCSLM